MAVDRVGFNLSDDFLASNRVGKIHAIDKEIHYIVEVFKHRIVSFCSILTYFEC